MRSKKNVFEKFKLFHTYVQHQGAAFELWLGTFYNEYMKDHETDWVPFVTWTRYRDIVTCFFELFFLDVLERNRVFLLPYSLGHFFIKERVSQLPKMVRQFGMDCVYTINTPKGPKKAFPKEVGLKYYKLSYRSGTVANRSKYYKFMVNRTANKRIWKHVLRLCRDPHLPNYKAL